MKVLTATSATSFSFLCKSYSERTSSLIIFEKSDAIRSGTRILVPYGILVTWYFTILFHIQRENPSRFFHPLQKMDIKKRVDEEKKRTPFKWIS